MNEKKRNTNKGKCRALITVFATFNPKCQLFLCGPLKWRNYIVHIVQCSQKCKLSKTPTTHVFGHTLYAFVLNFLFENWNDTLANAMWLQWSD